mgnify:CR=1 FL=1
MKTKLMIAAASIGVILTPVFYVMVQHLVENAEKKKSVVKSEN